MPMDETNFITHIKNKNKKALHYIVWKYAWIVKTVTVKHLRLCEDLQEDCMNRVFFSICENIEKYDEWGSSFENWLAGVARYQALECKRKYLENRWLTKELRKMIEDELNVELEILRKSFGERRQALNAENIYYLLNDVKTSSNHYEKKEVTKKDIKRWEAVLRKKISQRG